MSLKYTPTKSFWTIDTIIPQENPENQISICLNMACPYTSKVIQSVLSSLPHCSIAPLDVSKKMIQIADFENISWEPVLAGKHSASSFLVRKGLSRKAQLALQIKRYASKHPETILKDAVPYSVIIETWDAFEEMKLFFGGVGAFATFDNMCFQQQNLRDRLEFCLDYLKEMLEDEERKGWTWILKPSVANKGLDITIVNEFSDILDATESCPDMREWVLQRYIANPLTVKGHKFHLRVYVLCVGALKVYVYGGSGILMLLAAHAYNDDTTDSFAHLSNTAKGAELSDFDEKKFVLLLDDLPSCLVRDYPAQFADLEAASARVGEIRSSINNITSELFRAYENEYTVFSPMANCFEIYGLDFMLDDQFNVSLLEVNPGPDFKQTGNRLEKVIVNLWAETCRLVFPEDNQQKQQNLKDDLSSSTSFTKVYDKEWSTSRLGGGMQMK